MENVSPVAQDDGSKTSLPLLESNGPKSQVLTQYFAVPGG